MGSYNQVNGCYACQHPELIATLKDRWGWAGFVAPDFMFAVRDPLAAARAGLDLPGLDDAEGRTPEDFTSGRVSQDRLDDVVTRMVATMVRHDLLDRPAAVPGPPAAGHLELAAEAAVAGSVLLVNRAGALPLGEDVSSLAVIGPAGAGRHLHHGRIAGRQAPPGTGRDAPGRDPAAGGRPRPGRARSRFLG